MTIAVTPAQRVYRFRQSYSPLNLKLFPTLECWLDPDQEGSYTTGDPVPTAKDFSGKGVGFAQATGASQPTFSRTLVNGHAAYRFDGVDDYLTNAMVLAQPGTVILAMRVNGTPSVFFDGIVTTNRWELANSQAFGGTQQSFSPNILGGQTLVIVVQFNGANSQSWRNGIPFYTSAVNLGTNSLTGLTLGGRFSVSNFSAIDTVGLAVFSSIDVTRDIAIERNWLQKLGLAAAR